MRCGRGFYGTGFYAERDPDSWEEEETDAEVWTPESTDPETWTPVLDVDPREE